MDSEQPKMTFMQILGEKLFKARDYTPVPLILISVLFAQPCVISLVMGLLIALLGEWIRAYGVAFIGTISRTRSYSNGALVTHGPYAVIRNPLYLGNLILSTGLSITSGIWWIPVLVVIFFYLQYIPIVSWEEMKLTRIFGQQYTQYCQSVPRRWWPPISVLFKYNWYVMPDSWKPALKSEKRTLTAVIVVVVLMLSLYLWNQSSAGPILPLAHFISID